VAGPFAVFEPVGASVDEKIPMRLYCRQTLKKYVKDIA
jgi:aminopeptidase N